MERVLSDNGGVYRSHLWRNTCNELGIKHKRTRPYRPQTNSKIERFHRTLADGWAYARCYISEAERVASSATGCTTTTTTGPTRPAGTSRPSHD
ncbi:mobile element protein [Cutibacterium acnes JCM 18920]|nr:mobile element protein [Cutibacterium acnes JCM 18920]